MFTLSLRVKSAPDAIVKVYVDENLRRETRRYYSEA